ncbi:MAG: FHA domain-containing protein, partial [Gemmatimonadales bacterium]|nr:FHA domain-containing protein [Gemmatimonadales bacterium]
LEAGGRTYPIAVGEHVIGSDSAADLSLPGTGVARRHAVVQGSADGGATIRALPGFDVHVNGVRLGAEPTPVLHGDKLTLGQTELVVVDPRQMGHTGTMSAEALAAAAAPPPAMSRRSDEGRVVCLTDGREYAIGARPLVFGRDAGADVVVPDNDVSRRHAEIRPTDAGYVLVDLNSANGTKVNDSRIDGVRPLVRGDLIRIGPDEFRFHSAPDGPAVGAVQRLNDTFHGVRGAMPAVVPPVRPVRIASLLARTGALKGTRFPVTSLVTSVGRAEYNDVVLPDASVSTMHAKLQRRDGVWIVLDLGSTNGTFVDDELVGDEAPLSPGTTLRFGEVALLFESFDDDSPEQGAVNTRRMPALGDGPPVAKEPTRRQTSPPPAPPARPWGVILLVGLAVLAAAAAAFMLLTT